MANLRTVRDMLILETNEFEWAEIQETQDIDEFKQYYCDMAREKGLRFFEVLVKPIDDLLTETRPSTPIIIDVNAIDASAMASTYLKDRHNVYPLLAYLAYLTQGTYCPTEGLVSVPLPNKGTLVARIQPWDADLFKGLTQTERAHYKPHYAETEDEVLQIICTEAFMLSVRGAKKG